ncbi:MAG: hypothetical protein NVSMB29_12490 [Candidatus Dormibacteria bacterium]
MPTTPPRASHVRRNLAIVVLGSALTAFGSAVLPSPPAAVAAVAHPAAVAAAAHVPTTAAPVPLVSSGCHGTACPALPRPDNHPRPGAAAFHVGPDAHGGVLAVPRVGPEIRLSTRTCSRSRVGGTPTSSAACRAWATSGPVNLVIVYGSRDPYRLLTRSPGPGWRPALGGHLVAAGYLEGHAPGCRRGWTDSREQAELRLNHTDRRHLKLIHTSCTLAGLHLAFADAHTDSFDPRHCGGDRMIDLDAARDAVVGALSGLPGVSVDYRQGAPAGAQYPGGCGQVVTSDGRVAYITIA